MDKDDKLIIIGVTVAFLGFLAYLIYSSTARTSNLSALEEKVNTMTTIQSLSSTSMMTSNRTRNVVPYNKARALYNRYIKDTFGMA